MATRSGTSHDVWVPIDHDMPDPVVGDRLDRWCVALDDAYPQAHAEGWDQVGLHVGDPEADAVTGVLVALDVTEAVLDEAAAVGADLVITHHPLLFSPLQRLTPHTAAGRVALKAARQGCAVLAAHTNVDKAVDGTSHPITEVLGLTGTRPLRPLPPDVGAELVKVVTFVPRERTDHVIAAMVAAGAGTIGDYTGCAFTAPGTGTFTPGPGTSPHIGTPGQREHVEEHRVEAVCRRHQLDGVLQSLRDAHPYEEVPVDLYPLLREGSGPPPPGSSAGGLGVIGTLPEPLPLHEVARMLAEGLPSPHLRLAAVDADVVVSTVAACGGAGDSLIGDLLPPGRPPLAHVFVTGDLKHHAALDALAMGLPLIDAGHFATEDPAMDAVAARLEARRDRFGLTAPIHRSTTTTDPWTDWRTPR